MTWFLGTRLHGSQHAPRAPAKPIKGMQDQRPDLGTEGLLVSVLVSFTGVQHRSEAPPDPAAPQVRTLLITPGPPDEHLESMLRAASHQFESRIHRIADLGVRKPRLLSSLGYRDLPSQPDAGMRRWTGPPPRRPKPPKADPYCRRLRGRLSGDSRRARPPQPAPPDTAPDRSPGAAHCTNG